MQSPGYYIDLLGYESLRLGVSVALIDENGRLLLELRSDVQMWGITGGKLDLGESPQECGCREVYEETGIILRPNDLRLFNVYGRLSDGRVIQYPDCRVHLIDIVFFTHIGSNSQFVLSDESLALEFFGASSLPADIVPPARRVVRQLATAGILQ